jgi:hypothetical protein
MFSEAMWPAPQSSESFGVIVPVAGTDEDWARLPDLLDSLLTYESTVDEVVILDDGAQARPMPFAPANCKLTRLPNARAGRGDGWSGGLCAGIIGGLQYLHSSAPASRRFILRIDTDALVTAPFAARVAKVFEQQPSVGMIGSYLVSPNGKPRGYEYWGELLKDMLRPWLRGARRRRTGRPLPINFWGRPARLRRIIRKAMARGYVLGQSVQGGAYAISMTAINRLAERGYLADPMLWLNTDLVEDVMVSMLVMASGMELMGFAANGEVFGVLHKGLPDLPERLLERGYGIIHSVRNDPRFSEGEIRAFFQNVRSSSRNAPDANVAQ